MRALQRLAEPDALTAHAAEWTAHYVASSESRPRSARYAHPDVTARLRETSHDKCFYCEAALPEGSEQVDHYIEASLRRDLAFAWRNLYLACKDCNNGKPPNDKLPVTSCVDPCDLTIDPEAHLVFDGDGVRPRAHSALGANTLRKYKLNRVLLLHQRGVVLRTITEAHNRMLQRCLREGRTQLSDDERERLWAFADASAPFSRACAAYLRAQGL